MIRTTRHQPSAPTWRVGRGEFVAARIATVIVAVAGSVLLLQARVRAWVGGRPLTWTSYADSDGPAYPVVDPANGIAVHYDDRLSWQNSDPSTADWLLSLIPDLLTAAAVVAASVLVLLLINRIELADPFGGVTIWYVRVLAMIILGYGLLMPAVRLGVAAALTFGAQSEPSFGFHLDAATFLPIAVGLLLIVLTEVWRRGAELRSDTEGLV